MKRIPLLLSLTCLLLSCLSCQHNELDYKKMLRVKTGPEPNLSFTRYEDVLFHLDTTQFQQELLAIQNDFLPFLEGDLSQPLAIQYLKDFATDPFALQLYQKVKQVYPKLDGVEKTVRSVYQHFLYYYPGTPLPNKVYTCVSGIQPENPAVMIKNNALVISLDWYLDKDEVYDQIGMPQYLSERTSPAHLAKDLGELLYTHFIPDGQKKANLLEEMVDAGRKNFFIEALCPDLPDQVLLGYSPQQLEWAESNEGNLWADMVGNQMLYSNGYELYRMFLADGPFTNEYSHDAPARLGEFLGLHIVRSYMSHQKVTLQELMEDCDLQSIFQNSRFKPKK